VPFTTRRLPPPSKDQAPRLTVLLPRGPNILAFVSLTLALVVPAAIFFVGAAAVAVGFRLDFWPGLLALVGASLTSIGAIYSGIAAVRHAGGSREPAARRGMALLGLGLGYADVAGIIAFVVWTLIRAIQSVHIGG
jgi:hypothetical protein